MTTCPHCEQLSLESDIMLDKCYKCGYESYHEYPLRDAALAEAEALNAYYKAQADYRFALGHIELPERGTD